MGLLILAGISWRLYTVISNWQSAPVELRGAGDILTIAATGDCFIRGQLPSPSTDREFGGVATQIQSATLGLTNLEEDLLDPATITAAQQPEIPRWPYGTKTEAAELRKLGFTVITLANNHAEDYGTDGIEQTTKILDHAGLFHAGSGSDLETARAPVYIGSAPRRLAIIAIATSATSESRATSAQGDILARPGVSTLRYTADVTVDPATFATLKGLSATDPSSSANGDHLTLNGNNIKKGTQLAVNFVADNHDVNEILSEIRTARSNTDLVVVTLHSHEPSNQSELPAEFVEQFARAAIDAGASLVVGSGPHQLRGIETYKTGAIFYSLGNFAFDYSAADPRSVDAYDAGTDLYRSALGALSDSNGAPTQRFEEPVWWESVVANVSFERGLLKSIRLQPIDLGVDLPMAQRGTPRLAAPARAKEIIDRISRLSGTFGTKLDFEGGVGVVDLTTKTEDRKSIGTVPNTNDRNIVAVTMRTAR